MARYINADKLAENIVHTLKKKDEYANTHTYRCFQKFIEIIDKEPTAKVEEVRHGEWIEVNQTGKNSRHIKYTTKKCSVCGYCNGRRITKRCPDCGAKMDGEKSVNYVSSKND